MKFAYVSCLGDLYVTDDPDCDSEPCSICGDYDRCIGTANNNLDLANIMLEKAKVLPPTNLTSKTDKVGMVEITGYEIEKTDNNIEYKKVKDVEWEDE